MRLHVHVPCVCLGALSGGIRICISSMPTDCHMWGDEHKWPESRPSSSSDCSPWILWAKCRHSPRTTRTESPHHSHTNIRYHHYCQCYYFNHPCRGVLLPLEKERSEIWPAHTGARETGVQCSQGMQVGVCRVTDWPWWADRRCNWLSTSLQGYADLSIDYIVSGSQGPSCVAPPAG